MAQTTPNIGKTGTYENPNSILHLDSSKRGQMKIIRVIYTVRPEFVERNKANINRVMEDLRALGNPNTKYASYLDEDGVTFYAFCTISG